MGDPTASHYLKLMLDEVFGKESFRNEIVWCYTTASTPHIRQFVRCTDSVFWYSKGKSWTFNKDSVRVPYQGGSLTEGWDGVTKKKAWKNGVNEKVSKGKFLRVGGEFQRWEHLKNALDTRRKSH